MGKIAIAIAFVMREHKPGHYIVETETRMQKQREKGELSRYSVNVENLRTMTIDRLLSNVGKCGLWREQYLLKVQN